MLKMLCIDVDAAVVALLEIDADTMFAALLTAGIR